MYKLHDNGVIDLDSNAFIPEDTRNRNWVKYQAWISEGNSPEAKDPADYRTSREKAYNEQGVSIDQLIVALWEFTVEGRPELKDQLEIIRQQIKQQHPKS